MSEIPNSNSANSASLNFVINYNDPYFLSHGDSSNSQLGHITFNGANYVNWSRSVKLALGAKNKTCFIDGTLVKPSSDSPDLQKWIRNDYMVTGWILYSMEKSIAETFILTLSARYLWLELQERYGQSNAPLLYEILMNMMSVSQNDDSIAYYYGRLKKIWDKLQVYEPCPDCSCGALLKCSCNLLKKIAEADELRKLIQLIAGLNTGYNTQIEKQSSLSVESSTSEMSALLSMRNSSSQIDLIREILGSLKGLRLKDSMIINNSNQSSYSGRLVANVQEHPLDFGTTGSSNSGSSVDNVGALIP
ncbi:uncharacterized protein LOC109136400 [Beta vulgaris subsp. vulgaris]|uniref:uncharacterized protein LOC109136400 n=1 Tax=Beta vulgaris subsp. vulgaris TaxID=3555 RepID=UPI0009005434|nr:uncharacterized protein LOC109136400 [Beta vulgaris subsp. vulgaris]